jgi:hypothetical protein
VTKENDVQMVKMDFGGREGTTMRKGIPASV